MNSKIYDYVLILLIMFTVLFLFKDIIANYVDTTRNYISSMIPSFKFIYI